MVILLHNFHIPLYMYFLKKLAYFVYRDNIQLLLWLRYTAKANTFTKICVIQELYCIRYELHGYIVHLDGFWFKKYTHQKYNIHWCIYIKDWTELSHRVLHMIYTLVKPFKTMQNLWEKKGSCVIVVLWLRHWLGPIID